MAAQFVLIVRPCLPWLPMLVQVDALQEAMQAVLQHIAMQQAAVCADCNRAKAGLQAAMSRLQLELGSGGNIWLEEICPGDALQQWCQDLLWNNSLHQSGAAYISCPRDAGIEVRMP